MDKAQSYENRAPQTPAERKLISVLIDQINNNYQAQIIDLGAGASVVIENYLMAAGCHFIFDRVDIEDISVAHKFFNKKYTCSVENMPLVPSDHYDAVFANYLLEHVADLESAAREIFRIAKKGGIFVTTVPNHKAPEFWLAKITPLWFHSLVRGGRAWEAHYSFGSLDDLAYIFKQVGFEINSVDSWSFTFGYLGRFPLIGALALLYDKIVNSMKLKALQGNACLVFHKK